MVKAEQEVDTQHHDRENAGKSDHLPQMQRQAAANPHQDDNQANDEEGTVQQRSGDTAHGEPMIEHLDHDVPLPPLLHVIPLVEQAAANSTPKHAVSVPSDTNRDDRHESQ